MSLTTKLSKFLERRRYAALMQRIINSGLKIDVIFDIGANKGRWTRQHKRLIPNAKFFMFEANSTHEERLKKIGQRYFLGILSADGMPADFYRIDGTGDSLYMEKTEHYGPASKVRRETRTLSQLCQEEKIPYPDFIKLDVQGAELDVLRGGGNLLQSCSLVLMECPIVDYNQGAPSFDQYLDFMRENQFRPIAITEQHTRGHLLLQIDVLFARKDLLELLA